MEDREKVYKDDFHD